MHRDYRRSGQPPPADGAYAQHARATSPIRRLSAKQRKAEQLDAFFEDYDRERYDPDSGADEGLYLEREFACPVDDQVLARPYLILAGVYYAILGYARGGNVDRSRLGSFLRKFGS